MFNPSDKKSLDGLKLISRCPVCQLEQQPLSTSVLAETSSSQLVYIKCRQCGSGVVASLTPTNFGLASLGVVTDLNSQEIISIKEKGNIGADVLLQAIRSLSAKDFV